MKSLLVISIMLLFCTSCSPSNQLICNSSNINKSERAKYKTHYYNDKNKKSYYVKNKVCFVEKKIDYHQSREAPRN